MENYSDGLNPWRVVSSLPKGTKNTASGALSSQGSKPDTAEKLSGNKFRPKNNSSGKKTG
jgi:hypothetical protein